MIIVLKENPDKLELERLKDWLRNLELEIHYSKGTSTTLMGLVGDTSKIDLDMIKSLNVVSKAMRIQEPYKKVNRKFNNENKVIKISNSVSFGDGSLPIIAGPCTIETKEQLFDIAQSIKDNGASILRGGAFKPRSSPYSFQGLGEEGLKLLVEAKKTFDIPIISELTDISQIDLFEDVDIIQVGARNMQNFQLLKELSLSKKPILLKRSVASTLEELLMSAEYLANNGNDNIILCERGIKTFETATKNTLDLTAVPLLKQKTNLPVIVDPTHATGVSSLVLPMALSSVVAGADGIMVEVHNQPDCALCDGPQAILPSDFNNLVTKIRSLKDWCNQWK